MFQWTEPQLGATILLGLSLVSFALLGFLGSLSMTLGDQTRTQRVALSTSALELAHSGMEYTLWEMNYGGNNFQSIGPLTCTAGPIYNCNVSLGGGTVTFEVDESDTTPPIVWTISSTGISGGVSHTLSIDVSPAAATPPPGIFNFPIYAQNGQIFLEGNAGLGNELVVDGYDSSVGPYNPATRLPPTDVATGDKLVTIIGDYLPFRLQSWMTEPEGNRGSAAEAVVIDRFVNLYTNVQGRNNGAGESPGALEEEPGFAIYDGIVSGGDVEWLPVGGVTGAASQATSDEAVAVTYDFQSQPPDATYSPGTWGSLTNFSMSSGSRRICPNDDFYPGIVDENVAANRGLRSVLVTGGQLILGCTYSAPAGDPRHCDTVVDDPSPFVAAHACSGQAGLPLRIAVGGATVPSLRVEGTGKITVAGAGETFLHVHMPGTAGQHLFAIGAGGIDNQVTNMAGAPDTSKLVIRGHGGISADNVGHFTTTQAFHGGIYAPETELRLENTTGAFDFFGSANIKALLTDAATGRLGIHWDKALADAFPGLVDPNPGGGCDPAGGNPCLPLQGSFQIDP